jgi:hypothetical protein
LAAVIVEIPFSCCPGLAIPNSERICVVLADQAALRGLKLKINQGFQALKSLNLELLVQDGQQILER